MRHAFLAIAEKRHISVIHTAASLRIFPKKRKMEGRKESPPRTHSRLATTLPAFITNSEQRELTSANV